MIVPKRAPVQPRVISPQTGDSLLLEDAIRTLLENRTHGLVEVTGPAGSGKSMALAHLSYVLPEKRIHFLDESPPEQLTALASFRWVITTVPSNLGFASTAAFRLAPWHEDEWIEYLLTEHKDRCRSVMTRLSEDSGSALLEGNPELWRLILDHLAADESLRSVRAALLKSIEERFPSPEIRSAVEKAGLDRLLDPAAKPESTAGSDREGEDALVRHRPVQVLLAVACIVRDLQENGSCILFGRRLPRDLIREVASEVAPHAEIRDILLRNLTGPAERHATAASILHATRTKWLPEPGSRLRLAGAYLDGADWPGITLPQIELTETDLSHANLRRANLDSAKVVRADLSYADLHEAHLLKVVATDAKLAHANLSASFIRGGFFDGADLERADLRGADLRETSFVSAILTGACFREADLRRACFSAAVIDGADFSGADVEGAILSDLKLSAACFTDARFREARLIACDLEGMELPGADFRDANLRNALMTGTSMPAACFDGANLQGAGLADIDWEGASLRGADLTGVSFHLGSSRCGLVGSPIDSEGSRTGFYTDDFTEQDFKSPEEIRKANLCRADLRGARIGTVDFYLVDLRHALFDPDQREHLQRCGAILAERGGTAGG